MQTMKCGLAATMLVVWSTSIGAQETGILEPFFGNTWVYNANDGTKFVQINRDHTIRLLHYDGILYEGRWSRTSEAVCFHIGEDTSCFTDLKGRKLGVPWSGRKPDKNYTGVIRSGTLVDIVHRTGR